MTAPMGPVSDCLSGENTFHVGKKAIWSGKMTLFQQNKPQRISLTPRADLKQCSKFMSAGSNLFPFLRRNIRDDMQAERQLQNESHNRPSRNPAPYIPSDIWT